TELMWADMPVDQPGTLMRTANRSGRSICKDRVVLSVSGKCVSCRRTTGCPPCRHEMRLKAVVFPAPFGPDERRDGFLRDHERGVAHRGDAAEGLAEMLDLRQHAAHFSSSSSRRLPRAPSG